ncbi:MAG: sugar phosphate nucleotidyltransferase [Saprospiraceae bacterium]
MDATLVILAAGMGSRYGGLKQIDEFGPSGETILDYSIYDAIDAGFNKIVFVIRDFFKDDFQDFFKGKFEDKVEVEFVTQELYKIPADIAVNDKREKPWGTAHAVYVTKDVINEPFAVINADDYYGQESFTTLMNYFKSNQLESKEQFSLVGYKLNNTLSKHGTVNRGICQVNVKGELNGVVERLKIGYTQDGKIAFPDDQGENFYLEGDSIVSMNMWGFYPSYFDYCEKSFTRFLKLKGDELKSEYFIPLLIDELIGDKKEKIKVLTCDSEWFGVTYKEDKPIVVEKLNRLIASGKYPLSLWK